MTEMEFRRGLRVLTRVGWSLHIAMPLASVLVALLAFAGGAELTAQNGAAITVRQGRIVDVLGEPVPAATLEVVHGDTVIARGSSDAEGHYQVRARALSGAVLLVRARGKAQVRRSWGGLSRSSVQNIVLEDACSIRGVVVDASGVVVANASVVLVGGESLFTVYTDAAGRYELPAVPMRSVHLRAWGATSFAETKVWLRGNRACDFVLPRNAGGRRRIRVHGLPADAIASASVQVMSYDRALLPGGGRMQLGVDGTAEFLPGDTSLVRLVAPGFTAEPRGWIVSPGGAGELVFEARPFGSGARGAVLRGRVVDHRGGGVANARLVVEDRLHGHAGSGITDADGRFVLATELPRDAFCRIGIDLEAGQFTHEDARSSGGFSWTDTEADEGEQFKLQVETAGVLDCEIADRAGNRFAFGEVFIAPLHRPQQLCCEVSTDRLGNCEVRGLEEGEYMVAAISERGEVAAAEVDVMSGKRVSIGKWKWIPSGVIDGQVLDKDRQPMPGVSVHLVSPELFDSLGDPLIGRLEAWVRTDRYGMFRCQGLQTGSWLVALPDESGVEVERIDVAAGKTASVGLTLER